MSWYVRLGRKLVDKLKAAMDWCQAHPFWSGVAVGSWGLLFGSMFLYLVFK
jgi:hypothetical protein